MKQYNKYYILVSTNITVILNTLDHGTSIVHNLIVNIKAATTKTRSFPSCFTESNRFNILKDHLIEP